MRENFRLFKELLDEISWEEDLRDKGVEQSWLLFKDGFLRMLEPFISQNKKPTWLAKDLLVKLREKKHKYRQ